MKYANQKLNKNIKKGKHRLNHKMQEMLIPTFCMKKTLTKQIDINIQKQKRNTVKIHRH